MISVRRRAVLTFADQFVSSLGNVAVTVLVAHATSATDFGAFSMATAAYIFFIGVSRAAASDPLVVRFTSADAATFVASSTRALGASVAIGCLGSCLLIAASVAASGGVRVFLALALVLPVLAVQDCSRFIGTARGMPGVTLTADAVWTVAALGGCALLVAHAHPGADVLLLTWGGTSGLGAAWALWSTQSRVQLAGAVSWLLRQRDLAGPFVLQFVAETGSIQVSLAVVSVVSGFATVGGLRVCATIFGPMTVLWSAAQLLLLPEMSKSAGTNPGRVISIAKSSSATLVCLAAGWAAALQLVPARILHGVFGETWTIARPLLIPYSLFIICTAGVIAPAAALRSLGLARDALRIALIQLPLVILAPAIGAYVLGARGAAAGLGAAGFASLTLWWTKMVRTSRSTQSGA